MLSFCVCFSSLLRNFSKTPHLELACALLAMLNAFISLVDFQIARRKEREAAAAKKEERVALSKVSLVGTATINVEDKYRHMISPAIARADGAADGAWDD